MTDLSDSLIGEISSYLSFEDHCSLSRVNRRMFIAVNNPSKLKYLNLSETKESYSSISLAKGNLSVRCSSPSISSCVPTGMATCIYRCGYRTGRDRSTACCGMPMTAWQDCSKTEITCMWKAPRNFTTVRCKS